MYNYAKGKKKFFFFLFLFLFLFFIIYLYIPKFLNFSIESIEDSLKNNNNINIRKISKVEYNIFPTPRLSLKDSDFTIGKNMFEVRNSKIEIILNISQILNPAEINYKKLLIDKGFSKLNFNNINQILTIIDQSKKRIIFKGNNIVFFDNKKFFFEINNVLIKIRRVGKKKELSLNGIFLNNKVFIKLDSQFKNKNNLTLKIPEFDITTKVFFEKNKSGNLSGFVNLEVFNNFLKFNFAKKDNIKLTKGFIRSEFFNTSFEGETIFKPNFFSNLNFKLSTLNINKLYPVLTKILFSDTKSKSPLIKKVNGIFNFDSKIEGKITNRNGEVLFKNFKVGNNKSFLINAKIFELKKKGKINFTVAKIFKYKKNLSNNIIVKGFLIPSKSNIVFEEFIIDKIKLSDKKIKEYEIKFKKEIVRGSLNNIFNENKINKYFSSLF